MTVRLATTILVALASAASAQEYEAFRTDAPAPRVSVPVVRAAPRPVPVPADVPSLGRTGIVREESVLPDPVAPAAPSRQAEPESPRSAAGAPASSPPPATAPAPAAGNAPGTAAGAYQARFTAGQLLRGPAAVHDGHSLVLDGAAVRLDGVEAPALRQTCSTRSATSWRCGEAARARLAELASGRTMTCVVVAPAGEGAAASCSLPGIADVAARLVAEGLAVPNRSGRARYAALASAAASRGAGMWAGGFEDPARWRSAHARGR